MSKYENTFSIQQQAEHALKAALSFADSGKFEQAEKWGHILIRRLELAGVFQVGAVGTVHPCDMTRAEEAAFNSMG